jgi:hypothetical protein
MGNDKTNNKKFNRSITLNKLKSSTDQNKTVMAIAFEEVLRATTNKTKQTN